MLGVIAAVALVVGGIGTALVISDNDILAADQSGAAVVEVQAVQSADAAKTDHAK
jgi:regulator of RNase E activity RraA